MYKQYIRELTNLLAYIPSWLPSTTRTVGDVGIVSRSRPFEPRTTLAELGLTFEVEYGSELEQLQYVSKGSVSIEPFLEIKPQGTMKGEQSIKFTKAGSVLFHAQGCVPESIRDRSALERQLRDLNYQGRWERNWSVVVEVLHVATLTVGVATSDSGELVIRCDNLSVNEIGLASGAGGMTLHRSNDLGFCTVAEQGTTPLFKVGKLSWLGALQERHIGSEGSSPEAYLVEVGLAGLPE